MNIRDLMTLEIEYRSILQIEKVLAAKDEKRLIIDIIPAVSQGVACEDCGEIHDMFDDEDSNEIEIQDKAFITAFAGPFKAYIEERKTQIRETFAKHGISLKEEKTDKKSHLRVVED